MELFRTQRKSSDISENLDAIITDNKFRGTVYVKIGNALEYIGTNGFSDKDRHTKNSTDTCFRIASLTKQFTAVAVMQLVEEESFHLMIQSTNIFRHINTAKNHR